MAVSQGWSHGKGMGFDNQEINFYSHWHTTDLDGEILLTTAKVPLNRAGEQVAFKVLCYFTKNQSTVLIRLG